MIAVIQRVSKAEVSVDQKSIGKIYRGILALVAIEKSDTTNQVQRLSDRLLTYRIFPDSSGKMNLSVTDIDGGILLVPQFTLAADTNTGTRPSFTPAASPEYGSKIFDELFHCLQQKHKHLGRGQFGTDMEVSLVNDGPVTFILDAKQHLN